MPPLWFEQLNPLNVLLSAVALSAATVWTWGSGNTRVKRVLVGLTVFGLAAMLLSLAAGQGALLVRAFAMAAAFAVSLWTTHWVWRRKTRIASRPWWALLLGYAVLIGCAVHDTLLVTGPIAPIGPSYLFWGFTVLLVATAPAPTNASACCATCTMAWAHN